MARTRSSLAFALPPRSTPTGRARIAPRHASAFGRARRYEIEVPQAVKRLNDDLKQFITTFLGGFVFVTVLIG